MAIFTNSPEWKKIAENKLYTIEKSWGHTKDDNKASHLIASYLYREIEKEIKLLLKGKPIVIGGRNRFDIDPRKYQDDEILYANIMIETECPVSQDEKTFDIDITKWSKTISPRGKQSLNIPANAYKALSEFFNSGYCVRLKQVYISIWCEGSNEPHSYAQQYEYEDNDGLYPQFEQGWRYEK